LKSIRWLRMRKKTDPELPLEPPFWFGNQSNGEYFKFATKRDRLLRKFILEKADENARRVGMDRRDFLASAMGMCTTLWAFNYVAGGTSSDKKATADRDAKYCVPKEAMFDQNAAC